MQYYYENKRKRSIVKSSVLIFSYFNFFFFINVSLLKFVYILILFLAGVNQPLYIVLNKFYELNFIFEISWQELYYSEIIEA